MSYPVRLIYFTWQFHIALGEPKFIGKCLHSVQVIEIAIYYPIRNKSLELLNFITSKSFDMMINIKHNYWFTTSRTDTFCFQQTRKVCRKIRFSYSRKHIPIKYIVSTAEWVANKETNHRSAQWTHFNLLMYRCYWLLWRESYAILVFICLPPSNENYGSHILRYVEVVFLSRLMVS